MRRLYLRIYLSVLGSLALFAILAALAGLLIREFREADPAFEGRDAFVSEIANHLLPANASSQVLAKELEFWHEGTGYSLALISREGGILAKAGFFPDGVLRRIAEGSAEAWRWRPWRRLFSAPLADGRRLIAMPPPTGPGWFRHWRWLGVLFAIGLAVAICAYPVVRSLTKNLERLERGVAAFGAGDLSARVDVKGGDEVAKVAKTFNASAGRIEAFVKSQKILLANASHELRSPLARLRMAMEAAAATTPRQAQDEINRNIAELDDLVGEILLSSRLETADIRAHEHEAVDLIGLLAEECAPFHADLTVTPGDVLLMDGDARLLRRLFRNLLENAKRHGASVATEVSVRREGDAAIVDVCDRGPGISQTERDRIFEPFYRLKGMSESDGGTGLGLALVRQIAERHGGSVSCEAREGKGACFRVILPLKA